MYASIAELKGGPRCQQDPCARLRGRVWIKTRNMRYRKERPSLLQFSSYPSLSLPPLTSSFVAAQITGKLDLGRRSV